MEGRDKVLQFFLAESTDKKEDEKILQPYVHIATAVPSPMPHMIMQMLNYWVGIPEEKLALAQDIVDVLINSGLLIDDIQDNSSLRRACPTAHTLYGIQRTVLSAMFAMPLAAQKIKDVSRMGVAPLFFAIAEKIHRGQTIEIYWRDNGICPTEQDYLQMIGLKTGGIFDAFSEMVQLFIENKKNKTDFSKLMNLMGTYFQINDDYGNLCFKQYKARKGFCEDLTEGKFSFPIIHAINSHPEDKRVLNILKLRTRDDEVKKTCVKILEEYGSFQYTKRMLEKLDVEIRKEAKNLGCNPLLEELFDHMQFLARTSELVIF